jgi:hypothetical protein
MTEELCHEKFEQFLSSAAGFDIEILKSMRQDDEDEPYYHENLDNDVLLLVQSAWMGWQAAWNTRAEMEKSDD